MRNIDEKFFEEYFDLVEKTNGYVSHLSALYFLGQVNLPPEYFTLMTAVRRPDKSLNGFRVRFVYTRLISKRKLK